VAAEYEVNIKINSDKVVADLNKVDTKVKSIGKSAISQGKAITAKEKTLERIVDKRARLMNRINELESKGLNVAKLRKQMGKATELQSRRDLINAEKEFRVLNRNVQLEASKLRIIRNQASAARERAKFLAGAPIPGLRGRTFGPSPAFAGRIASPIAGTAGTPGSPEFNRALEIGRFRSSPIQGRRNIAGSPEARKARRKQLEQIGLGAGFPLLFGGGPGSVLGGAVGGLTGSFGAQIAFSAIGQQIDQFIASVASVGTALTSASGTVEMFREKNLFSSDAVKEHAFQLEEQGKMQELATLLAKDLASQIGKNAVENFQALGGEVKEFLGIINRLFLAIQGLVAGPLAGFLSAINSVLGGVSTDVQFGSLRGSLTGDAAAQFEAIVAEARGTRKLTGREKQSALRQGTSTDPVAGKLTTAVKEAVLKDPRVAKLRQSIDVTGQTSLDDTLGNQTSRKAAREAAQLQKRLDRLDAERQKVQDISSLQDKIAAAEQAKDQFLVIRLKGEQKLKDIEAKRLKDLAGVTKQSEIRKINELAAAKVIAAQADTAREINQLEFERQERFDNRIESLDYQLKIAEATTREEKERLRIEQEIKKLRDSGQFTESQLFEIKSRMEQLSDKNSPLNKFIQQTREEIERLNDPIFRVIELSKTLGDAFSESFRGIVDGSMTAQQALANLFQRTADHFIDMAAQMIAAQIRMQAVNLFMSFFNPFGGGRNAINTNSLNQIEQYSGIGANTDVSSLVPRPRANGGPVGAGQPYMVGERGPELFVPGAKGNIVPNNAMGGANVVVNVDASGSNVEGNADQASQLGKVIGIAVQQELVKQKRPGGLLAM
jgi:hypothetical protein|tara:strand:+ start:1922 stop:4426 length:2505 start_codon:yes stop_codon:yes gene_type:complete